MPFWRRRRETLNEQLLREAGLGGGQNGGVAPPAEPAADAPVPVAGTADGDADLRSPPEPLLWRPQPALRVSQFGASDLSSMPLPRMDDAVVTVDAPGLSVAAIQFVRLPDGTVLVEEPATDEDVGPLADAVERALPPPYRARCRRQDDDLWAVGAQRLDVRELRDLPGYAVTLTVVDGERTLEVDGEPSEAAVPALDAIAAQDADGDVSVHAERLDGDWWELDVGDL